MIIPRIVPAAVGFEVGGEESDGPDEVDWPFHDATKPIVCRLMVERSVEMVNG